MAVSVAALASVKPCFIPASHDCCLAVGVNVGLNFTPSVVVNTLIVTTCRDQSNYLYTNFMTRINTIKMAIFFT